MAIDVAEGMAYLHSLSPPVIHRDIKPHNVLLTRDGRGKLCDFGLVGTRSVTAGTPNYMAPELLHSKPHSSAVDVYAFGVLLNEMFAREVPWDGYAPADIKARVADGGRPPVSSTLPTAAERLVQKAWHQNATLRPKFDAIVPVLRAVEEALPLGAALLPSLETMPDALDALAGMGGAGRG